ncbi:MAG: peptide chain release factor 1 [Candidatus Omnitrophota bacterium]|nr:peptide chain release factor 1 [Candidatus Omnitrophota bacterium]
MHDKYEKIEARFKELEIILSDPQVMADKLKYQALVKELSEITELVNKYRELKKVVTQIEELSQLLKEKNHEKEFVELAKEELQNLKVKENQIKSELENLSKKKTEAKDSDIIVEIRAGTGGLEASLFAADLYRMYSKYALRKNWSVDLLSSHPTEAGGFKEIIFSIKGKDAFKRIKFESGVHRVQRVPTTEASGRIHTSTATVAVLIEPQEVELKIEPKDLKIDVFRSSGPGGQSVNTTDSAVRITHLPTGMVITCQDERSQLKNKNKAMRVLRARLLDKMQQASQDKVSEVRKSQIGTAQRSEKIRTYNFPDRRVTDHRVGFTMHQLEDFLEGDIDELIDALIKEEENLQ